MFELSSSHKARAAIREFKTITDSLALRGFYRPSGKFGSSLENCLKELSPEIYGSMNDNRVVELKGIEYVIDRLPQGIEHATKIILTDEDQFEGSSFMEIEPLKRRRTSYRINNNEICFIISRGISEIYDIITHMTFLNIEAGKIFKKMHDDYGNVRPEWLKLEQMVLQEKELTAGELDSALWNLSIILGRPYHETRKSYEYLEQNRVESQSNNGLFALIYHMVKRIEKDHHSRDDALTIYFTPSLMNIIGHQKYGKIWASNIDGTLKRLGLHDRPLHIISANMHSVVNMIYGYAAIHAEREIAVVGNTGRRADDKHPDESGEDIYAFFSFLKDRKEQVIAFAEDHGLYQLPDASGANIDCQLIDTATLGKLPLHKDLANLLHPDADAPNPADTGSSTTPGLGNTAAPIDEQGDVNNNKTNETTNRATNTLQKRFAISKKSHGPQAPISDKPVILVMDYAFGTQAFELMEQLLKPIDTHDGPQQLKRVGSISIMGKAGILSGDKGDIMLATAHVCEGSTDNYLFANDLTSNDFKDSDSPDVFIGPMATVLGTSLQNRDVLEMFKSDWKAIGLEMEGGHYQKAINAAIIKGNIPADTRIRYAYYASDNPLMTGNTLAAGAMGQEGVKPTYMITKVILDKILNEPGE